MPPPLKKKIDAKFTFSIDAEFNSCASLFYKKMVLCDQKGNLKKLYQTVNSMVLKGRSKEIPVRTKKIVVIFVN